MKENDITNINAGVGGKTVQIFARRGTLGAVVVTGLNEGTTFIVDNTTGSTPVIAELAPGVAQNTYFYNSAIKTGLRVISNGVANISVTWRQ